jgi:hypothetical protein
MSLQEEIDAATDAIVRLFIEQCTTGRQSSGLPAEAAACGQFIGREALAMEQRGLHGTAAALRVLASCEKPEAKDVVRKLTNYISQREELMRQGKENVSELNFAADQNNIIKIAELLYALTPVRVAQSPKEELALSLIEKLRQANIDSRGWPHFIGDRSTVSLLPTAFAVLALCQHCYESEFSAAINELWTKISHNPAEHTATRMDSSVRIFCLYALAFRKEQLSPKEASDYRTVFLGLWRQHEQLLDTDVEQNLEYSRGGYNYYVRIPWQLYLLAIASKLRPTLLASQSARRRIRAILAAVLSTGFSYPHSGNFLASRTNGILYDVLQKIRPAAKEGLLLKLYGAVDKLRLFLGRRCIARIAAILYAAGIAYICIVWLWQKRSLVDTGSDLLGSLIMIIATSLAQRVRKTG